jgi:hypothetical protein
MRILTHKHQKGHTQAQSEESSSSSSIKQKKKQQQHTNKIQKYFLLCESCFWCVSYIGAYRIIDISYNDYNTNCPVCKTGKIESLPISL